MLQVSECLYIIKNFVIPEKEKVYKETQFVYEKKIKRKRITNQLTKPIKLEWLTDKQTKVFQK